MRAIIAILVVFVALKLVADERRVTYYPGSCPNGQSWYLIDSDSDSITVGCNDPDYNSDPDPDLR